MMKKLLAIILSLALLACTGFTWPNNTWATEVEQLPAKPVLKSVESKSVRTATVKWETVSNVNGYDIRFAKGKTAKTVTVTPGTLDTKKLTNLLGGKKYKVKIRSFRISGGKRLCSGWSKAKSVKIKRSKWSDLMDKYGADRTVRELVFVKYKGSSKADLILYKKTAPYVWKKVLKCKAYTGQKGLDKKKEGDRKTPTGVYTLSQAFGIKANPGSKMNYVKVNQYHYWCGDRAHYNQLIDIRTCRHNCRGEHLIDYTKQYAYAMAIDYNSNGVYGKGSAIFLHCFGNNPYTLGCVAVSEENMKTLLKTCENNTKICIYKK